MVSHQQRLLVRHRAIAALFTIAAVAVPVWAEGNLKKFYADDPMLREPPPLPVKRVAKRQFNDIYDFLDKSFAAPRRAATALGKGPRRALDINTLGDVPDSAWYTKRHYWRRMSIEELKRGPGNSTPPSPTGAWQVISGKNDGVTPGFVIEDEHANRYLLKLDPADSPELASAVDVIGSKLFYALGYNTPENYIVHFRREQLEISAGAKWRDASGKKHALTKPVLDRMLIAQPKGPGGAYRALASRFIEGELAGPFRYDGMRTDDPNDIVPHEDRRVLRALSVFAAWVNHHDTRSLNSMDSLVEEDGIRYLKHYLIDFGSIMGSAGYGPKYPWTGHRYIIDNKGAVAQAATLGFYVPAWARAHYPNLTGVGLFDSWSFDPVCWKPEYPNPAFLMMDSEDAFWAAKQVAAFTDEDIRALVETGEYSDPRATEWITNSLIKRRDKISEAWFSRMMPLDHFDVADGALKFEDLGAYVSRRDYSITWTSWDRDGAATTVPDASGRQVPAFRAQTQYLAATITCAAAGAPAWRPITVYLRRGRTGPEVAGIDR